MAHSKYIKYKNQDIPEMKRVFSNIVVYDQLKTNALISVYLKKEIITNDYSAIENNRFNEILDIDNAQEKRIVISKIKNMNRRVCEIAYGIYCHSKLSDYIQYSEISSDLVIAVKSMFILSTSKTNPMKEMTTRINEFLSFSKKDFRQRNRSTQDICRVAIYFSVISPDVLSKNKGDIKKSVYGTKGGKELIDLILNEMKFIKERKSIWLFRSMSFWFSSKGFYKKLSGY